MTINQIVRNTVERLKAEGKYGLRMFTVKSFVLKQKSGICG